MKFLNIKTETKLDKKGEALAKTGKTSGLRNHCRFEIVSIEFDDFDKNIHFNSKNIFELKDIFSKYGKKDVVFIHNMNECFQILRNILIIDDVFARTQREPLYFKSSDVEYRDFEALSGERIESILKRYGCDRINDAMHHFIVEKTAQYGSEKCIPLTYTGELRKEFKEYLCDNWYDGRYGRKALQFWSKKMNLMTNQFDFFSKISKCFFGGQCDFNSYFRGKEVENVSHYDIDSSYIWSLLSKKYPDERFIQVDNDDFNHFDFAYIYEFECDIFSSKWLRIIKTSMNSLKNDDEILHDDTGDKILEGHVKLTLTDVDFEILKKTYQIENLHILAIYRAHKSYLPYPLYKFIIDKYKEKKTLKNRFKNGENVKRELDIAKQKVCSIYGCCITNLIFDEIEFDNDSGWKKVENTFDECFSKLNELKKGNKILLNYSWGVWCSAYSRERLFDSLIRIGSDAVYCDTDAIFYIDEHKRVFEIQNIRADALLKDGLEYHNLKNEFENVKGLGHWEFKCKYDKFKTIGKKRYITECDGKIEMTHAGINKELGCRVMTSVSDFKQGFVFDRHHSGRTFLEYIEDGEGDLKYYFVKVKIAATLGMGDSVVARKIGTYTGYSNVLKNGEN